MHSNMCRSNHRDAFHDKQEPQGFAVYQMEGKLKAAVPPPAASQNARPIIPGPGLTKSLANRTNKSSLLGTIAYLGHESVHPANSWVRESQPQQLNPGAFNHPVLILAQQENRVLCALCTSWNGRTPQEKWTNSPQALENVLYSHMELLSTGSPADCATEALGGLFHSGPKMERRTFVSLQRAFWTESHLLEEFTKGANRQLNAASLGKVCWAYTTALHWRQQNGVTEDLPANMTRTPGPVCRPTQRGRGAPKSADDCKFTLSGISSETMLTWRNVAARRDVASMGRIHKTGGWNGTARRSSGGFMKRENWRRPAAA